jgi:hypothetical protein
VEREPLYCLARTLFEQGKLEDGIALTLFEQGKLEDGIALLGVAAAMAEAVSDKI